MSEDESALREIILSISQTLTETKRELAEQVKACDDWYETSKRNAATANQLMAEIMELRRQLSEYTVDKPSKYTVNAHKQEIARLKTELADSDSALMEACKQIARLKLTLKALAEVLIND